MSPELGPVDPPAGDTDPGLLTRLLELSGTSRELLARVAMLENHAENARQFLAHLHELDLPTWVADTRHGDLDDHEPSDEPGTDPGRPASSAPEQPPPDEPPVFDVRVLVAWVAANVTKVVARKLPQSAAPHWCRQWYHHAEAVARLESVRRSWLEACQQPTGNGLVLYFEHLDHQLAVLMGETGPFASCRNGVHCPDPVPCLGQDEPAEEFYLAFEHAQTMSGGASGILGLLRQSAAGVTVGAAPPVGGRLGEHGQQVNGRQVTDRGRGR